MTLSERIVDRNQDEIDFPLTSEKRIALEGKCAAILQKKDFGAEDFNKFAGNMLTLARTSEDPMSFARIRDEKEKQHIVFIQIGNRQHTIAVRGRSFFSDNSFNSKSEDYCEGVTYKKSKAFFIALSKMQPISDNEVQLFCGKVFDVYLKSVQQDLGTPKSS